MSEQTQQLATRPTAQPSALYTTFGERYGISPGAVSNILAKTIIASADQPTQEEIAAAIVVCNQYGLNPFTKEIFAFKSKGKMLYVVSVDGYCKIINEHKELNGIEFVENFAADATEASTPRSITCRIHRKDRVLPTVITEYMHECRRESDPWKKSPIRMLRHRALIQCARVAFGFAGIMDEDDAEVAAPGVGRIIEAQQDAPINSTELSIREYATKLGYNAARLQTLRSQYEGRDEFLLSFLKTEYGKKTPQAHVLLPARTAAKQGRPTQQQKQAELEGDTPSATMSNGSQDGSRTETANDPATSGDFFEFDQSKPAAEDDSDDIGNM